MRLRIIVLTGFILSSLIIPFSNINAQEIKVASGVSVGSPSNSGAATASIPIEVPPGRKGMQPNLALTYNSNRRNGWIGVGWDLPIGEIQRSTKRGVDYNANDYVVVMNGTTSELVARGDWGADFYGAKIEGAFTKYQYDIPVENCSGGWKATTKDGRKHYFGCTASSRQDAPADPNKVFKWMLDKVEDTNGNYMTLSYTKDQGEIYLDRIDYTGNTNTGIDTTNYVKFWWEGRNDIQNMYTANFSVKTAKRLKTIGGQKGDATLFS